MKKQMRLAGFFSGRATLSDAYNNLNLSANIVGEKVSVAGKDVGMLTITSDWDNLNQHFNLLVKSHQGNKDPMVTKGIYTPRDKYLDVTGHFDGFNISYFQPFFTGIVSDLDGQVHGDLHLYGPFDKLILASDNAMIKDAGFLVDFTKVKYKVTGPVKLNERGLTIDNGTIEDRFGNKGHVVGGLIYKYFRNLQFNTTISFSNMECLNLKESDNSTFYGTGFGSGIFSVSGSIKKILLDISVATNKNTTIHIPLASTSEATNSDLLNFVKNASITADNITMKTAAEDKKKSSSSELTVKLKANITPDAAMLIEIDKSVGDVITGYGKGLITMDIKPSADLFNIQGDYLIDRGSYKFVLQGIFNRDFIIQQGGNIGFNGNIAKTTLNLTAGYKTKAAINALISDTSSVGNRRNVDCLINMTGPLMNPTLSFSIDIPDLDPLTKSRVNAALNTEDKVIKQVMSILVSNSFIPDIQSSIVNNSTLLYSNATEVLSNQINKIFNQLDIPVDLSFNYQPGQNGKDFFDAAVSAELFNNRVIIDGNIGNSRYTNSTSDVVGDFDAEIKLDEKGRFRVKLFSHSADQYSNYLDNSQRNGGGLVYQEEFTTFRELIRSIFTSKKKRKAAAAN